MSAEILRFSDFRSDERACGEIDLVTAVDVAIRDLREILMCWGSEVARQRTVECELMLRHAFCASVVEQGLDSREALSDQDVRRKNDEAAHSKCRVQTDQRTGQPPPEKVHNN